MAIITEEKMISVKELCLNLDVLAITVYKDFSHKTTSTGVLISEKIREELIFFLKQFQKKTEYQFEDLFFRIDAFIGKGFINIIEINVELQDGWGVSLNLLRAADIKLPLYPNLRMPKIFIDYHNGYRPEFELACRELQLLGLSAKIISATEYEDDPKPIYPLKHDLDSKIHLARFSVEEQWSNQYIKIPRMYYSKITPWDELPEDIVFKFCNKYGPEAIRARYSVIKRKDAGKAKFVKECYEKGSLIAQDRIEPLTLEDGSVTQVVIMCAGSQPVTGYLQVSPPQTIIINDKTAKAGPLLFTPDVI